jgi:galactokinase
MDQSNRITNSQSQFTRFFNKPAEIAVSSPGRVELIGNHTDHQCGCVLAASIGLDTLLFASKREDMLAIVRSEGFPPFEADLCKLEPQPKEEGTSAALVRGVASKYSELGYKIGGFEAFVTSDVPPGSGLSSSASFELAVCSALNHLYNKGRIDPVTMAKTARYAENRFFMKPCGLMDQMACSLGGAVAIDMRDPENPIARKIPFDADGNGFALCITSTGGCHSDLTGEYAAIPKEMHDVAAFFGKNALRFCSESEFYDKLPEVEKSCGERAVKRAMHFFGEQAGRGSARSAFAE